MKLYSPRLEEDLLRRAAAERIKLISTKKPPPNTPANARLGGIVAVGFGLVFFIPILTQYRSDPLRADVLSALVAMGSAFLLSGVLSYRLSRCEIMLFLPVSGRDFCAMELRKFCLSLWNIAILVYVFLYMGVSYAVVRDPSAVVMLSILVLSLLQVSIILAGAIVITTFLRNYYWITFLASAGIFCLAHSLLKRRGDLFESEGDLWQTAGSFLPTAWVGHIVRDGLLLGKTSVWFALFQIGAVCSAGVLYAGRLCRTFKAPDYQVPSTQPVVLFQIGKGGITPTTEQIVAAELRGPMVPRNRIDRFISRWFSARELTILEGVFGTQLMVFNSVIVALVMALLPSVMLVLIWPTVSATVLSAFVFYGGVLLLPIVDNSTRIQSGSTTIPMHAGFPMSYDEISWVYFKRSTIRSVAGFPILAALASLLASRSKIDPLTGIVYLTATILCLWALMPAGVAYKILNKKERGGALIFILILVTIMELAGTRVPAWLYFSIPPLLLTASYLVWRRQRTRFNRGSIDLTQKVET